MTETAALPAPALTLEEQRDRLNRQAERGAGQMVVGQPTDGCQPVDLTHVVLRIHRGATGRAVQFDIWSRATHGAHDPEGCYFVSMDGCTCEWYTMRCQRVPGAVCKHIWEGFGPPESWPGPEAVRTADEVEAAAARVRADVAKMFR